MARVIDLNPLKTKSRKCLDRLAKTITVKQMEALFLENNSNCVLKQWLIDEYTRRKKPKDN